MSATTIYAWTGEGGLYPPYVNVGREEDGSVRITVRAPADAGWPGAVCSTVVPAEVAQTLGYKLLAQGPP